MQTVTYGKNRIDFIEGAGGYIRPIGRAHLAASAVRHVRAPTTAVSTPLGRDRHVAIAVRALGKGRVVNLHGPCGIGKSTVLRHLALTAERVLGRPGVYLDMQANEPAEDVAQRLLESLGLFEPHVRATPEQSAQVLAAVRPIVVVDNDACDAVGLSDLMSWLPSCAIIVGSERPIVGRDGMSFELPGLDDEDALTLMCRDAGRELTTYEHAAAARLSAAVGGRPLPLRQAAALVRAGIDSFEALADAVERDGTVLARLTMTGLDRTERHVFGLLSVLAGTLLPADLVEIIGEGGKCREALTRLRDKRVIESSDDRFGLPACRAPDNIDHFFRTFDVTSAVRDIVRYVASSSSGSADALSLAKAVVTLTGVLAKRRQWESVVALVEVAEPILTLAGRWATCRRLLDLGVHAAHEVGDFTAEAMFRHEHGTLALCSGQVDEARAQLTRAWRLRRDLGNDWAADITLHNLRLLAPAPPAPGPRREPAPLRPRRLDRRWAVAGAVVATLVLVTGLVNAATGDDITADPGHPSPTPTASPVTSPPVSSSPTETKATIPETPATLQTTSDPSGEGTDPEPPSLTPRLANLGRYHLGSPQPPPHEFTLRNDRGVAVAFGPPTTTNESFVVGADAGACGGVVAPHSLCTIKIGFVPTEIGPQEGKLVVPIKGFSAVSAHLSATGFRILTVVVVKAPTSRGEVINGSGRVLCSTGRCRHEFSQTPIELTASGGCTGLGCSTEWTGCSADDGLQCSIGLDKDRTVTATFAFNEP